MGRLTTHVLDTAHGVPAAGVPVALYALEDAPRLLAQARTNADGRCDRPLLEGESFRAGRYELVFQVEEYFRALDRALPSPAFVGEVVLRFGVADPAAHYHVPLLVSPWSYSTYRGS